MNTMAAALMKAKVVTEEDIRLTEKEEKEERERIEAERLRDIKFNRRITTAMSFLDNIIVYEIRTFMEDHPGFLTIDILETMADNSAGETIEETKQNSKREWSKLLSAFRESQQAMTAS